MVGMGESHGGRGSNGGRVRWREEGVVEEAMELTHLGLSLPVFIVYECWPLFMCVHFHGLSMGVHFHSWTVIFIGGGCHGGHGCQWGVMLLSVGT